MTLLYDCFNGDSAFLYLTNVKTYKMLSVQPFYKWTLRFYLLSSSEGSSGRLYDGQVFKPVWTELSFFLSSDLLPRAFVGYL
jgi:hypothetical protein